jgi:hypothetical protein
VPVPSLRWLRPLLVVGGILLAALVVLLSVLLLRQREAGSLRELQIVQGVRKVCKLSTVEVSLADYARRSVPKIIDIPFTESPEAFLFYSGVISAGFDVCDEPARILIHHEAKTVEIHLPPPRILSLDVRRFEIINERSGLLNSIEPNDRNQWFDDARKSLKAGALSSGILPKAEAHARELFGSFVEQWGYELRLSFDAKSPALSEPHAK